MEIFYCASCRKRVSSVDLENGHGFNAPGGKIVCRACAKDLGIQAGQTPEPQRRAKTPRPSAPVRSSAHGSARLSAADAQSSKAIILALVLGIVLLGGILAGVLIMSSNGPAPAPVAPASPVPVPIPEPIGDPAPEPVPEPEQIPPAGKDLPAYTPVSLPPGEGWRELAGPDWARTFEGQRGIWDRKDGFLQGTFGGDAGAGVLRSVEPHANAEFVLDFAVRASASVEVKFNQQGSAYGRVYLRRAEPGRWHSLRWKTAGNKLLACEFNGTNILASRNALIDLSMQGMPASGDIGIAISPHTYPETKGVIGRLAMRSLSAAEIPSTGKRPAGDWVDLLHGNSFADAGWTFDMTKDGKQDTVSFIPGTGIKAEKPGGIIRLIKRVDLDNDFTLEIDYEGRAKGWDLFVGAPDYSRINLEFYGDKLGRHQVRIEQHGTEITVLFDGKPFKPVANNLTKPLGRQSRLWVHFYDISDVTISRFRYKSLSETPQPAAPKPGPALVQTVGGWTDLMPGNPFTSGWKVTSGDPTDIQIDETGLRTGKIGAMIRVEKKLELPANVELEFEVECSGPGWDMIVKSARGNEKAAMAFYGQQARDCTARMEIRGTNVVFLVNGKPFAKKVNKLTRPLAGTTKLWIQLARDTKLHFRAFRYRDLDAPAGNAPSAGWINVMQGASLAEAGWEHQIFDQWRPNFRLVNGALVKQPTPEGSRLDRRVPINNGDITFTTDFTAGGSWEFILFGEQNGVLKIESNRKVLGRHTYLLKIQGTSAELYIDGKPAGDRVKFRNKLKKPMVQKKMLVRFEAPAATGLTVTEFRYRTLPE